MISFNTPLFLFLILPLSTVITLLIREKLPKLYLYFIIFLSLVFYHFMSNSLVLLLIGSALLNFFFIKKRIPLILSVTINFAALLIYKYLRIGFSGQDFIPLGISFYLLQQVSALVDSDKDQKLAADLSFANYFTFVTMYPQLIAGPIIRLGHFTQQIINHEVWKKVNFRYAALFIIMGLFKKVVIADSINAFIFPGLTYWQAGEVAPHAHILTHNLLYGLMVYYDFSGYSEMAVGIAHLLGFQLPMNFNSPFKRDNIADFWRSWHITIHSFMVDYFYRPFVGKITPLPALFLTFFFLSIWHGSSMNFFLFGLYHATIVVLYKLFKIKLPKAIGIPLTTVLFGSSAVLFYGRQSISELLSKYGEQFLNVKLESFVSFDFFILLGVCLFTYFAPNTYEYIRDKKYNIKNKKLEAFLFGVLCFMTALFMERSRGYVYFEF